MNKLNFFFLSCILPAILLSTADLFAQQETFDLATYTPLKGWKKDVTENAIQFTNEDPAKNTYCIITLLKSVPGTTDAKNNFDATWSTVVKEMVTVLAAPEMQPASSENGWDTHSGYAPFENDGQKGVVVLVTSSSDEKMMNLIILTNTDAYQKTISSFLESITLKKQEPSSPQPANNIEDKTSVLGTWVMGTSGTQKYDDYKNPYTANNYGYSKAQYTFNTNGTYQFVSKTFRQVIDKIILVKENGTYQVSGNTLTIQPQKSVIESWSKKDGTDKWGKLLSTQKRTLEKTVYRFTKHYFSGIQLWNLVLQSDKVTQRDGPFSGNTTFSKAWYYAPVSANNTAVELPGDTPQTKEPASTATAATNNTLLAGTWCISASDQSAWRVQNGVVSTIFRQYTFASNGTYIFITKTFDPMLNSILLGRENGTYQLNADIISITPQKSVLEEWSKKDGRDEWGKLLKTQNIALEKAGYRFSKYFIPDNNEWQLILKADKETKRDGPFNGSAGSNTWIYILSSAARPIIKLPG
jgi:hypothetical protein